MNATFQNNLPYLTDYNNHILDLVQQQEIADVETLQIGEDLIFKLVDEQGDEFYSGSLYDPAHEAHVFLEGTNFDNTGYIVMGLSSTAMIRALLERKTENAWLFIIEPDLALVKKFLEEFDLSRYLREDLQRLVFFSGEEKQIKSNLSFFCNSLVGYYLMQTEIFRTFPSIRRNQALFDRIFEVVASFIKLNVNNIGNSLEDTLMGIGNELKNLKYILEGKRFRHLKDKYKDVPIICVASGPSLDKQIPLLRQAKGKAVIICAESTLRVLLNNGIEPDFVCILERGAPSFEISLAGIQIPEQTALVGLTLIDSRIYEHWNSYAFPSFKQNIAHSHHLNDVFEDDIGEMYSGSSSAHLCFALAIHLGGNPIVFIGQDLSYSLEGATHSKDSLYVLRESKGLEAKQIDSIHKFLQDETVQANKTVYLDGYYGGKVRSRDLWAQFKQWMENMISVMPVQTVINATEGGVRIEGTEQRPFQEVVETFCTTLIPSVAQIIDAIPEPEQKPKYYLQLLMNHIQKIKHTQKEVYERVELNRTMLKELYQEIEDGQLQLVEIKAARVLRNTENLIKQILGEHLTSFYYRPLIAQMHIKTNPISRIDSLERLQTILSYQDKFLQRVSLSGEKLIEAYENGFSEAVAMWGYTVDDFDVIELEEAPWAEEIVLGNEL